MTDVLMPQMGESIVEGTVTKWLKSVGETVERDEPLLEISTDKVDSEVPAPGSGLLVEVLIAEGQTVGIHTVLARIQEDGEGAPPAPADEGEYGTTAAAEEATPTAPAASSTPSMDSAPSTNGAQDDRPRLRSSPLVRRLAKEHGIDLHSIAGTGQGGRISKKDIEKHLESLDRGPAPLGGPSPPPASGADSARGGQYPAAFSPAPEARFGDHRVEPLSTMRKRIAEHMLMTKRTAPHVSTIHQVDVTAVARLRDRVKTEFMRRNGVKLTYMPFFLRAAAAALKAYPLVNASLDGEEIVYHNDVNVGVAVALDPGLIVPVIPHADEKSVVGLQKAVADLAFRARNKQLRPEEVRQGTFSISNYGAYGSLLATPAINQPQSAILGLGAVRKEPLVIDDAIAIRSVCYVTLTFDHRLLDGAVADSFLSRLKTVIEGWTETVL